MKFKDWAKVAAIVAVIAFLAGYNGARSDTVVRCSELGFEYVDVELGLWHFEPSPFWRKYCVAEYDGYAGKGSVRVSPDRAKRIPHGSVVQ